MKKPTFRRQLSLLQLALGSLSGTFSTILYLLALMIALSIMLFSQMKFKKKLIFIIVSIGFFFQGLSTLSWVLSNIFGILFYLFNDLYRVFYLIFGILNIMLYQISYFIFFNLLLYISFLFFKTLKVLKIVNPLFYKIILFFTLFINGFAFLMVVINTSLDILYFGLFFIPGMANLITMLATMSTPLTWVSSGLFLLVSIFLSIFSGIILCFKMNKTFKKIEDVKLRKRKKEETFKMIFFLSVLFSTFLAFLITLPSILVGMGLYISSILINDWLLIPYGLVLVFFSSSFAFFPFFFGISIVITFGRIKKFYAVLKNTISKEMNKVKENIKDKKINYAIELSKIEGNKKDVLKNEKEIKNNLDSSKEEVVNKNLKSEKFLERDKKLEENKDKETNIENCTTSTKLDI